MVSDETGRQLHDRATRGETLTTQEQAQLNDWYEAQDRAELDSLDTVNAAKETASLQNQVNSALAQLIVATRRIQEITQENETLRSEISAFRHQLAQQSSPQPV